MAKSIVNETPKAITENDLTNLHPPLWQAQSLCRMIRLSTSEETAEEDETPLQEQCRLDIQNAADVIENLLEQANDAIDMLEKRTIDLQPKEAHHG